MQCRVPDGLGNNREADGISLNLGYRQTDAVDRDGGLAHDVARQRSGHLKTQPPVVLAERVERNQFGGSIYVAENEMTIQTAIEAERPLRG